MKSMKIITNQEKPRMPLTIITWNMKAEEIMIEIYR